MTEERPTRREMLKAIGAVGTAAFLPCRQTKPSATAAPAMQPSPTHGPGGRRPLGSTPSAVTGDEAYLPLIGSTPSPAWETLSFIVIMCDTLRYDHIGFHGGACDTPNIDAFAAQSQVFDRAYAGGFPTVLNRAEMFTGRYLFPYMGWEDMPADETVIAQVMNDAGYTTGLVFDTYHLKAHQFSFDRAFSSWQWVRGQEDDRYLATPRHPTLPASPDKLRHGTAVIEQYLRNVSKRQDESDYFIAQTIETAKDWLKDHYQENNFFLHIDAFDPHEPWDPPQSYVDRYDPGYEGEEIIYPAYAPTSYLSAGELNHVRALYAAEVSLVDRWLGELFTEIDRLALQDRTVVVLTSDHGILLGEHDLVGKAWDHQGHRECYPLYEELIHIPFLIRVPGMSPRRIADLAQPADLMPTILEWAGADDPGTMQGVSLLPAMENGDGSAQASQRTIAVAARSLYTPLHTDPQVTVTDGAWALIYGGAHAGSELYYLADDPHQQTDLLHDEPVTARDLHGELIAFLESVGTAQEYLDPWRTQPV